MIIFYLTINLQKKIEITIYNSLENQIINTLVWRQNTGVQNDWFYIECCLNMHRKRTIVVQMQGQIQEGSLGSNIYILSNFHFF